MRYFIAFFTSATLVFLLGSLNVGAYIENYYSAILVALVMAILNGFVRPILEFISLPLNLLTFGLFSFLINSVFVLVTGYIVSGFSVHGFLGALMFGTCFALAQTLAFRLLIKKEEIAD
nr:phage holin family protein [uncultured Capnocytophaga sp.]